MFPNTSRPHSKYELFGEYLTERLRDQARNPNGVVDNTLRQYQIWAALKTREHFEANGGVGPWPPALIVAPTGSGKSGIVTLIPYVLRSQKVLVLSPSRVITTQLAEAFGHPSMRPNGSWSQEKTFFFKTGMIPRIDELMLFLEVPRTIRSTADVAGMETANLVIVNAQRFGGAASTSLVSDNVEVVQNVVNAFAHFSTIIVDEAHHYPAQTWRMIVNLFRDKQIVFLTATPYRQGQPILGPDQRITFEVDKSLLRGVTIRDWQFSENPIGVGLPEAELYTLVDRDVQAILDRHDAIDPAVRHQAMILVRLVHDAEMVARSVRDATYFVSGNATRGNDEAFRAGQFRTLVVCGTLLEGYDNSNVSLCVILRKVTSTILFKQFIGRCLRLSRPGDPVIANVHSYPQFQQKPLWDEFDQIAVNDPTDNDELV